MKIVIGIIVVVIVLLGAVYGLGRAHMLPLKSAAKSSPALKKVLLSLNFIAPDTPKPVAMPVIAAAQPDPLAAQKQQLADEQAQLDQEKAELDRKLAAAAIAPPAPAIAQTSDKLVDIYEAMDSDDLAALFAKQPDSAVVSALIAMDAKKAANALSALPPDRAAKITALMNQAPASTPAAPTQMSS